MSNYKEVMDYLRGNPGDAKVIIRELGYTLADEISTKEPVRLTPCPSDLTAVCASVWDNWAKGKTKESKSNRYGISLEVWTGATLEQLSPDWKGSAFFYTAAGMKTKIQHLRKTGLSPIYLDEFEKLVSDNTVKDMYYAPLYTKNRGMHYFEYQFVMANIEKNVVSDLKLVIDPNVFPLTCSLETAVGKPFKMTTLGTRVIGQARHDPTNMAPKWSTDPLSADEVDDESDQS